MERLARKVSVDTSPGLSFKDNTTPLCGSFSFPCGLLISSVEPDDSCLFSTDLGSFFLMMNRSNLGVVGVLGVTHPEVSVSELGA